MNTRTMRERERAIAEAEYGYMDRTGRSPQDATTLFLTEPVIDILVTFPASGPDDLGMLTTMLLNLQCAFGRQLEPQEAGAILYSPYQSYGQGA